MWSYQSANYVSWYTVPNHDQWWPNLVNHIRHQTIHKGLIDVVLNVQMSRCFGSQIIRCCVDPGREFLPFERKKMHFVHSSFEERMLTGVASGQQAHECLQRLREYGCVRLHKWQWAWRDLLETAPRASWQGNPSCCCTCNSPCASQQDPNNPPNSAPCW
jgi:hypothetical protein